MFWEANKREFLEHEKVKTEAFREADMRESLKGQKGSVQESRHAGVC